VDEIERLKERIAQCADPEKKKRLEIILEKVTRTPKKVEEEEVWYVIKEWWILGTLDP
jgi:hypothetical protein